MSGGPKITAVKTNKKTKNCCMMNIDGETLDNL